MESGGLTRFHVGVAIAGALMCFGPASLVLNSWAIFLVPVSTELGVSTGLFSLQPSILFLACALFAPIGGRLIERFDLKPVLLGACIAGAGSVALCGFCNQLWQFFAFGALEGCAGVVLIFLMLPILIGRWFHRKTGTVIGICIACAGLGGALWAYLGGVVIVAAGWRASYHVLGLLALALSLPTCLLLLHNHPEKVGVLPFGAHIDGDKQSEAEAQHDPERGVPAAVAFRSPTFFLFAIGVSLTASVIDMTNLLPSYVYYLGDAGYLTMSASQVVMAASTIALCTQIAQGIGKIVLGAFADRSAIAAFLTALVCGIAGIVCMMAGKSFPAIIFTGGALFGALFSITDVIAPVMARGFFGSRDYTRIYSRAAGIMNLIPAFAIFLFANLSDISWTLTFTLGGTFLVAAIGCGLLATRFATPLKMQ